MTPALLATLATLPGRCLHCGWHTETQGHHAACVDADEPLRRGVAGMARTVAAHPADVELVDAAIRAAMATGEPFSANSFRHLVGQVKEPHVIGSRIRAAVASKRIKRVGDEPSSLPNTNGHRIGRYVATP